jgi:hypothetical protein
MIQFIVRFQINQKANICRARYFLEADIPP